MGLGSIWSTVKQKFSAGVAATIAVAGTAVLVFVNMPGHPAQYGLYNPTTGDTLQVDSIVGTDTTFNWKHLFRDSLFWDTIKVRRTGSMGTGIGTAQ